MEFQEIEWSADTAADLLTSSLFGLASKNREKPQVLSKRQIKKQRINMQNQAHFLLGDTEMHGEVGDIDDDKISKKEKKHLKEKRRKKRQKNKSGGKVDELNLDFCAPATTENCKKQAPVTKSEKYSHKLLSNASASLSHESLQYLSQEHSALRDQDRKSKKRKAVENKMHLAGGNKKKVKVFISEDLENKLTAKASSSKQENVSKNTIQKDAKQEEKLWPTLSNSQKRRNRRNRKLQQQQMHLAVVKNGLHGEDGHSYSHTGDAPESSSVKKKTAVKSGSQTFKNIQSPDSTFKEMPRFDKNFSSRNSDSKVKVQQKTPRASKLDLPVQKTKSGQFELDGNKSESIYHKPEHCNEDLFEDSIDFDNMSDDDNEDINGDFDNISDDDSEDVNGDFDSESGDFCEDAITKKETKNSANQTSSVDGIKQLNKDKKSTKPLTVFQKAREKLNAARFRFLNEQLYTSTGRESLKMFQHDQEAFRVYHQGYQVQVSHWPLNPLDIIVQQLRNKPACKTIADFGCGDGRLAESLPQKKVNSFDLVALKPWVTVCDMSKVPLVDGSVDAAVFCLSLMGTNLSDYLCEANRVLKTGGMLKIAEVVSRFQQVNSFVQNVEKLGFQLLKKTLLSKMFYLFTFRKIKQANRKSAPAFQLQPCLYKRR